MEKYMAFWKRGWWAWLMVLCCNVCFAIAVVPLAMIFGANKVAYWTSAIVVWLIVGAPLMGWLFERFAVSSPRLILSSQDGESV